MDFKTIHKNILIIIIIIFEGKGKWGNIFFDVSGHEGE